jgi:regulator of protease activity HflC (stomatin/prohibitin superfamily)
MKESPVNPLRILRQHKIKIVSLLFILLFLIVYLAPSIFIYIYPGQAGLLFSAFSTEPLPDRIYREGLYVIAPWNRMYIYDITKQKRTLEIDALTNNGLFVNLRVSVIFHPNPKKLKELLTHIGPDYTDKVIIPTLYSAVRQVIGNHTPEALYTTAREILHDHIIAAAQQEFTGLPFLVEEVVVEKLAMPDSINAAIENKLKSQQDALAYQYLLAKQVDEAKRQKIEAAGIHEYQAIVGSNLTPALLKWLEIRALHDLSQSQNSKIIVLGNSEEMPLVLDTAEKR